MSTTRAQVTIPHLDGLPADSVTNTWHFFTTGDPRTATGGDGVTAFESWVPAVLHKFYATGGWGSRIGTYLSGNLDLAHAVVKLYDLADDQPRVPYHTEEFVAGSGAGGTPIPEECAIAMSYRCTLESGQISARRRGRIFLGPLATTAVTTSGNRVRVVQAVIDAINAGAHDLASEHTADCYWTVWSEVDQQEKGNVVAGWCDNAFDTQRRRGPRATARTLWAL